MTDTEKLLQAVTQWQPIETAPKEGWLLVMQDSHPSRPYVAKWATEVFWEYGQHYEKIEDEYVPVRDAISPTHWMPLPDISYDIPRPR